MTKPPPPIAEGTPSLPNRPMKRVFIFLYVKGTPASLPCGVQANLLTPESLKVLGGSKAVLKQWLN